MLRAKLRFRWVSVSGDNGKCLKWLARWLHLEELPPRAPHLAADRNPPPRENWGAVCSDPGCAVILQGVINSLVIKRKPKYLGFPCSLEHPAVPFRRCVWVLGSPSASRGWFLGLVQNQGSLCWTSAPAGSVLPQLLFWISTAALCCLGGRNRAPKLAAEPQIQGCIQTSEQKIPAELCPCCCPHSLCSWLVSQC